MMQLLAALVVATAIQVAPLPGPQPAEDPEVRAIVDRFFAAQEAEDAQAYLALWSAGAERPRAEQLKFVFDSGDDKFSDITIRRVSRAGDRIRVLLTVTRERTPALPRPGMPIRASTSVRSWSLTLVREGAELRILSEGLPTDDLAVALLATDSAEERDRLMSAEPELLNERLVYAINRRGDNLAQAQRHTAAAAAYERALEVATRVGAPKAEGEAWQNLGTSRYMLRDYAGARTAYESRLRIERQLANEPGIANALLGVATIRYSQFEYAPAIEAYRQALEIFDRLQDDAGAATALISTGNVQYLQGDLEGAIVDYRRSREISRRLVDTNGEARALDGLGRVHVAQGDYAAALEAFAGVQAEGRARGNVVMEGNALQSTAEVHLRLGNHAVARQGFDAARRHFETAGDASAAGRVWQGIALADLMTARFAAAEQGYASSHTACTKAEDADCAARATLGLAYAQFSQEKFDEAIASYGRAITAFTAQKKPADVARAEIGLSRAQFGKGDYATAAATAVTARDRTNVLDVVWRGHDAEARALRRLGLTEKARSAAAAAVKVVETIATLALDRPRERVARDVVSAYATLAILQAEAGDAAGAFATLEARRARALRLALAVNERDIVRGMTADAQAAERAAANAVGALLAQIEKEEELPKPDRVRIASLDQRLSEAITARRAQQQRMFDEWPDLRVWRGLAPPASVEEISAYVAAAGMPVVQFAVDDDDLLVVIASAQPDRLAFGAHVVAVKRQALAEMVAAVNKPAALRDDAAWRAAIQPLADALPKAVHGALASAPRAVVVPDDILWRVPFEALPSADGYIGARTAITYAESVTALLRPAPVPPSAAEPAALAVAAAPEVSAGRLERVKATAPEWVLRAGEQPAREVAAIVAAVQEPAPVVVSGAAATELRVRELLGSAAALHVAAPFRLNSASPLFSPMLLTDPVVKREAGGPPSSDAPVPAPENDGVLEAREVMNLDLRAKVAVLSDGAALAMRDAAGAVGTLQWTWRAAGVPVILVARWAVDDESSNRLLADFHARVSGGDSPEAALQGAQAAVRANEATRAPWYWAGWILVGR